MENIINNYILYLINMGKKTVKKVRINKILKFFMKE